MEVIIKQIQNLAQNKNTLTFLCNASAAINEYLNDVNWVGFYLLKNNKLMLGPFQGKVACELIEVGKGVCGTAIKERKILNVKNVHEFKGHIACDNASKSEIVLPLMYKENIFGVLDIDSPMLNRFSSEDENVLAIIANEIAKRLYEKSNFD